MITKFNFLNRQLTKKLHSTASSTNYILNQIQSFLAEEKNLKLTSNLAIIAKILQLL